ncbi:Hypothetical predicted protein [Olea europaea subsp. europaea]|uniref:Uncharacterized protein n=1 Tax=Olea europaea subsp. europaea TaxID=158383 RepID=A0A8S0QU45_OLEEU|nr:Hypothetical predicted protein [Olea europaea subsp. europaea]
MSNTIAFVITIIRISSQDCLGLALTIYNVGHTNYGIPSSTEVLGNSIYSRQTPEPRIPYYNMQDEEKLRYFPHLRHLKCYYIHSSKHCPYLSFSTKLESLSMSFEKTKIKVINFPANIKKRTLSDVFPCNEMMSSIGKFPNLNTLKLEFPDFKGENWSTNEDEFLKLKFLKLKSLKFENWNTSKDHFPTFERLVLENCYHFERIPSELGYIPTLQMIEVNSCGTSIRESANEIKEEQVENGNEELMVIIYGRN